MIGSVQALPEELFDIQPQGFSNTIRWHVGHMVTMFNWFLAARLPIHTKLPEHYHSLFITGSKPADWSMTPPPKEELMQYLSAQLGDLSVVEPSALSEPLNPPFEMGPLKFETVGEVFHFTFIHEAIHLGTIASLAKVIQANLKAR